MFRFLVERTERRPVVGSAVAVAAAVLTLLLGLTALAGRYLVVEQPARVLPPCRRFIAVAALALVFTAGGMLLAVFGYRRLATLCGILVGWIGLVGVADHALWSGLRIAWFRAVGDPATMPVEVALCLLLAGTAVAIMPQRASLWQRPLLLILLGAVIFGLGLAGFVGTAAPYQAAFSWISLPQIALHAAIAFMAVGIGLIDFGWRQPRRGEVLMRDLRNSIIIYTTFGMLLMIVVSALLAVLPIYGHLCEAQQSYLLHATRSKADAIQQFLWRAESIAMQISSRTRARQLLEAYRRGDLSPEQFAAQSEPILSEALANSREVRGIARLDRQGKVLVAVGTPVPPSLWPEDLSEIRAPVVSGPVLHDGSFHVAVATLIKNPRGEPIGEDVVLTQFPGVHAILADELGLGVDTRLVLRAGRDGNRSALVLESADGQVALSAPDDSYRQIALSAEQVSDGLLEPDPDAQERLLTAYARVENTDWFVLAAVDAGKLYYAVDRQLLLVLAVVGLLALLGAGGIYLLLRPLTGVILIQTDLLEKRIRDATAALVKSEERFELAVRGTDAGIWDWDLRTDKVHFSPRWKSMLGYAEDELGDDYAEWERRLHPDDRDRALETVRAYQAGETPHFELEHRLRHKDGSYRWILARGTCLRDADGRAYRMVGSHIDVTARKLAEERLKRTAAALEQSNRDLEQFAYIASHDLQEPVRMMSSYLQALAKQHAENLPGNAHSLIDLSLDAGRRIQQLINDLLAYSRVQTRPVSLRPVDCNEVFEHAVENLRLAIEENSAEVTGDDLPIVVGDYTQLVQLLQNLIGNAIKFRREEPPRVHVSAHRSGERWTLAVHDNGIGIEAEYAATIFEVFRRLHTSDRYPGTGIGLAVCKRIIERHGGEIWFESEPGRGTTFYFTLLSPETREDKSNSDGNAIQSVGTANL